MKRKGLNHRMIASILSSFDSCYLNMFAGLLRKGLSLEEAHSQTKNHIHELNTSGSSRVIFHIGHFENGHIEYNNQKTGVHILISSDSVEIRSFIKERDKEYIDSLIDYHNKT